MTSPPRWKGFEPALAPEHVGELLELRAKLADIPRTAELAKKWGVSMRTARDYLRKPLPKKLLGAHGRND